MTSPDKPNLTLGSLPVAPPVVLAPMAGITNVAFRQLCREHGAGIYVCEMVMTRALVERNEKTLRMVTFAGDEKPRSLQLYGVDPVTVRKAVEMIAAEDLADHVDMNFGCPVPRVTRKGGGAALPYKRRLFGQIVEAAVQAAAPAGIPVTVKMRIGIDEEHHTFLEAGRIAQDAGAAWVALHGRTAAQRYSGEADWTAIKALKDELDVPVLGNGDIWEADDALRMMSETGADGVVVGRGCLGRPWLFADLAAAFAGRTERKLPDLGEVMATMRRHAELLSSWLGAEREGVIDFRKHVAWYLKGFPVGGDIRRGLAMSSSLAELDAFFARLDPATPFPTDTLGKPRGRTNSPGKVTLPYGWLDDRDDDTVPAGAEMEDSGG
ncbi:tRNA dihydrouridine synthase DusB [Catenulispora sp. NF23]|uniref:tRNA-dihydrouridine synthase n=1 Tax=Catenulispora pinistramenti TaxID=2705254 RepID=A0ABS5L1J1_9ACTN|nr:tRNA dihydrouridine synthase DusB [Catenulispora pinistramenti]MBS2535507.1 tRNA dihydrouridine synthase DusB [Catenulispora pinistramenti]MBS2552059.1 tRNA dihydrouridine synthase DusB [Catenulispora pinistramenti]